MAFDYESLSINFLARSTPKEGYIIAFTFIYSIPV